VHSPCLAIGFLLESFPIKFKVLRGGFNLWLGDNIFILSMVKRAHPILSNTSAIGKVFLIVMMFPEGDSMKNQEEEITYCNLGTTENPKIIKLSK
jgi:hypothetical protein